MPFVEVAVLRHCIGSFGVTGGSPEAELFVLENPSKENRSVKQVLDDYVEKSERSSCSCCKPKVPVVYVRGDPDNLTLYKVNASKLASRMSTAIGENQQNTKMVYIVNVLIQNPLKPLYEFEFLLEISISVHTFKRTGIHHRTIVTAKFEYEKPLECNTSVHSEIKTFIRETQIQNSPSASKSPYRYYVDQAVPGGKSFSRVLTASLRIPMFRFVEDHLKKHRNGKKVILLVTVLSQ